MPVDHAFNVKGVGVVVLGVVTSGVVQKHATLNVLPGGKSAQVRSIQKHDDEFDVAGEGDRVGLALKNVEVEDLDRGAVLTNDSSIKTSSKLETPCFSGEVLADAHKAGNGYAYWPLDTIHYRQSGCCR